MCMSSPDIPPPPPPVQETKQPQTGALMDKSRSNRAGGMSGGSLLTGPSGVAAVSTGRNTLLGG